VLSVWPILVGVLKLRKHLRIAAVQIKLHPVHDIRKYNTVYNIDYVNNIYLIKETQQRIETLRA